MYRLFQSRSIIQLKPSDVEFLEKFHESENSVYHNRGPSAFNNPDRELNLFVSESTTYHRMQSKGPWETGVIPSFYGTIQDIQPLPPYVIFIEYIQSLQTISLSNFSEQHLAKIRQIQDEIHEAYVLHDELLPRNMMTSLEEQDKDTPNLSPRSEMWVTEGVEDYNEGRLNCAIFFDHSAWFV
ncbi:hypothetical protein BDV27DRAFT_140536 [Aspergillus caelatus]|uniref:Protein kinase domain-containing protein n=1 Tax=Aspergillus caelatus TaxID=61420 RepID=A0A5N7AKW5_9EURO|nr:uncharacterized protein BDV27DRAFT_140536 [Aspergillus caelatus]KAE8370353.1 hypothetical protein BDV27DRAFT_140536 [Aspergillus caelatus]